MIKCGKECLPECGYFTSAGCVSPFNCVYKIEKVSSNNVTTLRTINGEERGMKDYKRLTDRVTAEMLRNTEGESWDSDNIEAQCYIRLAELEDKIESGKLDYVADKDAEIASLTAENSELKARLETAVELPVKLGDEVFFFDFNENKVQQGKVIGIRWNYFTPSNPIWVRVQYDIPMIKIDCDIEVWLSMVFTTREAAEARLAELRGK